MQSNDAQVNNAKLQLSFTRVTAPIAGKLGLRQVDVGNLVRSGDANGIVVITQMQPDLGALHRARDRPARGAGGDAPRRHPRRRGLGSRRDHAPGHGDACGPWTTRSTRRQARSGCGRCSRTTDDKLFPNQFVNINLNLSTLRAATVVPSATIQRASFGTFVYVIKPDGKATIRKVVLGAAEGDRVAITEGVAAGRTGGTRGRGRSARGHHRRDRGHPDGGRRGIGHRPGRGAAAGGSGTGHARRGPGQAEGSAAMNISRPFIQRPVATALLMAALLLSGALAYRLLPVSALPQVDYPTIRVLTFYPGASPDVMTSAVTAPLERQFGQMPGLDQMSSTSSGGASVITLRFSLDKAIEVAEQEVQAAINAASNLLPNDLPQPPVYNKVNPADTPVLTLAITSPTMPLPEVYDLVDTRIAQKLSQLPGVGLVSLAGGQRPAVRIQANPQALAAHNLNLQSLRAVIAAANVNQPKGNFDGPERSFMLDANDQLRSADAYRDLIVAYEGGAPLRLSDVAERGRRRGEHAPRRVGQRRCPPCSSTSSGSPAPTSSTSSIASMPCCRS